jgi:hypothetical protein
MPNDLICESIISGKKFKWKAQYEDFLPARAFDEGLLHVIANHPVTPVRHSDANGYKMFELACQNPLGKNRFLNIQHLLKTGDVTSQQLHQLL